MASALNFGQHQSLEAPQSGAPFEAPTPGTMYGVVKGVYYCHQNRTQELNDRIYDRVIPSAPLQPYFSPRDTPTRRTLMPMVNCYQPSTVPIATVKPPYTQETVFNPGMSAPYSGFALKVDDESRIRSTIMPYQKYNVRSQYVPSSTSDMYSLPPIATSRPVEQTHPLLFREHSLSPFNPTECSPAGFGGLTFNNATRQQTKDNIPGTFTRHVKKRAAVNAPTKA
jgi:hypothetical protein